MMYYTSQCQQTPYLVAKMKALSLKPVCKLSTASFKWILTSKTLHTVYYYKYKLCINLYYNVIIMSAYTYYMTLKNAIKPTFTVKT